MLLVDAFAQITTKHVLVLANQSVCVSLIVRWLGATRLGDKFIIWDSTAIAVRVVLVQLYYKLTNLVIRPCMFNSSAHTLLSIMQ